MRYPFRFETPVERFGVRRARQLWYNVLFLPPELAADLPFAAHPRLRVEGEIAELPVEGAWMPTGDGRRYFIVAPRVLKAAALTPGDLVEMRFGVADQATVDVPPELAAALVLNAGARRAWDALTAGKRRAFAHRVGGAKGDATRARQVAEAIATLSGA